MVGVTLVALIVGRNDPGFVHNGPLAGLVAVCAGSDVMHPIGALLTGAIAGGLFVQMFTITQNRWRLDDVLGVWPLHGLCGAMAVAMAFTGGLLVYGIMRQMTPLRLSEEQEFNGADLSIHQISATPESDW